MRRIQAIKSSGEVTGNRTRVKVKKNKVAPPFTEAEFDIMYNTGISRVGDVLDLAVIYGQVDKRGAYFRYGETLLGQGRENAKTTLREDPELTSELENLIRVEAGLLPVEQSPDFEATMI
jgi:recombination protein RecA